MAKKQSTEDKKAHAKILYMSGEPQNTIAERVSVSKQTINAWTKEGGWKEVRAAKSITRPELVNKILLAIDTVLNGMNATDGTGDLAKSSDQLSKLAAVVERLDKRANVVDVIEVFIDFDRWLQKRSQTDDAIDRQQIVTINRLQDMFVAEQINNSYDSERT